MMEGGPHQKALINNEKKVHTYYTHQHQMKTDENRMIMFGNPQQPVFRPSGLFSEDSGQMTPSSSRQ